jgi:hypothetical protein
MTRLFDGSTREQTLNAVKTLSPPEHVLKPSGPCEQGSGVRSEEQQAQRLNSVSGVLAVSSVNKRFWASSPFAIDAGHCLGNPVPTRVSV